MKEFKHINPTTVEEAVSTLASYGKKAAALAGGTDLLCKLVDRCLPEQPEYIVNLKTLAGLSSIKEEGEGLSIGALVKLDDIVSSSLVKTRSPLLAQAASKVASWQIRNMGTIGGNICQETRCWYFRSSWNKFPCLRKNSSGVCDALVGDNRYHHSIFGASNGCVAANLSDVAPALVALDATIVTSSRSIAAEQFFDSRVVPDGPSMTVLNQDEIVTEIKIPPQPTGAKQAFVKASIRRAIDFALVNCAVVIAPANGNITSARIVLGGVAPVPRRAKAAEDAIVGKTISEATADSVASEAVKGAATLPYNKYKIQVAKGVLKQAILY